MGETILVTGSTGFIGSRLLSLLEKEGAEIKVFLRPESAGAPISGNIGIVRGSFTDDEALAGAVRGADRIVHLAGVTKAADAAGFEAGNVMPVRNLLTAVRRHNPGLKRFLLVSSLTAAGPAKDGLSGVRESEQCNPVSAYGRSKLMAEKLCMEYAKDIPVTIIRPPAVYGPGDRDILQIFQMLAKGVLISAGRTGRQRFSMIYVDDLLEGILLAARAEKAVGELYYLTSPCSFCWDDVIAAARPVLGFRRLYNVSLPVPLVFLVGTLFGAAGALIGKSPLINRDKANELVQDYWVCSPEKAERDLGFIAGTPLEKGVAITIDWYRRKGWM
ncbi:NAD-dependent epimerase/dehydratase family protein [Chlorobium ferrooxidans]|uniref:NAD-dependent epimerase/dehydratase:Short-chain dehydrogenase/reductase SDR:3-beta hydroxysteroid dehydrogenase/isomerase:Polysaccharide biosynthesis protein CapD:dTDP-4-dehydrorhamnose reductase n=1 Tax=Chlorobium ferrooxidans DSM 13031 TaxID=377431 RepID=Q0YQQ6_9CHLB|nr:NAD-dependent epimerase/dehydratase family protein [Chlorobium ferrooxidans]EAT58668.1 NAD-dependent epimerase/dehydratase:Short-chain dehydrogenase/reductase SDR:3-beta hydroxysteroid dehydrogenase/isomerase:Polysaccharide biosynthesis protein CapD:dTDP-4-dehydrorhamnose reductase [Chlorobium ferrooxidans DSM 13031]